MHAKKRKFEPGNGYAQEDWDEVLDIPELTAEQIAQMKPFAEAFPELAASIKRVRGSQKAPTKELISIRIDRDTLDAYRATGPGWQARINLARREALTREPSGASSRA